MATQEQLKQKHQEIMEHLFATGQDDAALVLAEIDTSTMTGLAEWTRTLLEMCETERVVPASRDWL